MSLEVHWYEGLFLQPHHLQLMQRTWRRQVETERRLARNFPYGLIEADLSKDELEKSNVVFNSLHLIMRSGLEVRVPDNAILSALEIGPALAQGGGSVTIYLGVPRFQTERANAFKPGQEINTRVKLLYRLKESEVVDENTGDNPRTVQLRLFNTRLLLETEALQQNGDMADVEILPLLRIKRTTNVPGDLPRVDPEFIPPCLLLRGSATLYRRVSDLLAKLEVTRRNLEGQLARGGLGLDTKLEITQRLCTLNRYCGSLPSLVAAPAITPFEVYIELRRLLGELAALQPAKKMFDSAPYDHDKPFGCFDELDEKIRSLITWEEAKPLEVAFKEEDGRLAAQFVEEHFSKPNGWYLGIRTPLNRNLLATFVGDGDRFKLMPKSRAGSALFGVELQEENFPPHDLPPGLHYFRIGAGKSSPRWEEIMEEKAAVLIWNNSDCDLSSATFSVYMTLAGGNSRT